MRLSAWYCKMVDFVTALHRSISWVCFGLFLILGVAFAAALPPFQAPDEIAHWEAGVVRSALLSGNRQADAKVPTVCSVALSLVPSLRASSVPFSTRHWPVGFADKLQAAPQVCEADLIPYGNVLTYPGVLLTEFTLRLSQRNGEDALRGFYQARWAQGLILGLVWLRLLFLAHTASRGPVPGLAVLGAVSLSPLFLQASFSITADLITNASVIAFAIPWVAGERTKFFDWILVLVIGLISAGTKYTTGAIFLAYAIAGLCVYGRGTVGWRLFACGFLCAVVSVVSGLLTLRSGKAVLPIFETINPGAQIQFVLSDPLSFWRHVAGFIERMFVVQAWLEPLGWLQVPVPRKVLSEWGVILHAAAAVEVLALLCYLPRIVRHVRTLSRGRIGCVVISQAATTVGALTCVFGTALILYLTWTPVGYNGVLGVQQRYFYPPLILLLLAYAPMASALPLPLGQRSAVRKLPIGSVIKVFLIVLIIANAFRYLSTLQVALYKTYF